MEEEKSRKGNNSRLRYTEAKKIVAVPRLICCAELDEKRKTGLRRLERSTETGKYRVVGPGMIVNNSLLLVVERERDQRTTKYHAAAGRARPVFRDDGGPPSLDCGLIGEGDYERPQLYYYY